MERLLVRTLYMNLDSSSRMLVGHETLEQPQA